jgi:uncharacterized membrane protein YoaK (UPF0700 family)
MSLSRIVTLPAIPALLSVTAGYIDTAGFLALHGLFTTHVTGNFVTLAAALVQGSAGTTAKILALPVFCLVVFATRLLRFQLEKSGLPVLGIWITLQFILVTIAAVVSVHYGPFPDADTLPAISTGLVLVVAMAIQNAFHRIHLSNFPPSTIMTGTTTQAMLDLADLVYGLPADAKPVVRTRVSGLLDSIVFFGMGCAASALVFAHAGPWVFVGGPILSALTVAFYLTETLVTNRKKENAA